MLLSQLMETDPNSWASLLREFGPWGSFIVVVSVVFIRVLYWLKPHAEQIIGSHVGFVDMMAVTQKEMAGMQQEIVTTQQQILAVQQQILQMMTQK